MPSQLHEFLLSLFSTPFALLLQSLCSSPEANLPAYRDVRLDSANFAEIQPAEYRADQVVTLLDDKGVPVMGIIVEVQRRRDDRKPFVWLSYVANLRARLRCPVGLLVVTLDESVARWAARRIDFGFGNLFAPMVMGPAQIPKVTDVALACRLPQLAMLSVMAHGRSRDVEMAVKIAKAALRACERLDAEKCTLYGDVVFASLSKAAQREVRKVDVKKWEWMSDWARENLAEGAAGVVRRLLAARFGKIPPEIERRIRAASAKELADIGERILTATSVGQVFAPRAGRVSGKRVAAR